MEENSQEIAATQPPVDVLPTPTPPWSHEPLVETQKNVKQTDFDKEISGDLSSTRSINSVPSSVSGSVSGSSSVSSSPLLGTEDTYLSYAGLHSNDLDHMARIDTIIGFDETATLNFQDDPIVLTPSREIHSELVGVPELTLFSSQNEPITGIQTPNLESASYSSRGLPYLQSKPDSYTSMDDDISLNADMSCMLHASERQHKLPNSMDIDADVFSDSDGGRDGFQSSHGTLFYSSALELEGAINTTHGDKRRRKPRSQMNILTPSPIPSRQRKGSRRKSRNSEANSERSRSEFPLGSGYTQTPTSGKIFRNLLILEESLRQQVMQQRTLRRKYLTFLAALCSLIAGISHHLYVSQDRGPFRVLLQLLLLMLIVTLLLYHLSGEYQKTIVLPRKFLSSTNKGLRQLNVRLVKIKTSYTDSSADLIREFGLFLSSMALKFFHTAFSSMVMNPSSKLETWLVFAQLHCQPRFGLNDVKLVLIPRSFSTDIREGWELYRNEFWVNEGVRRRNAALEFTRPKAQKKTFKERLRKRRTSAPPLPLLNEGNINVTG